MTKPRIPSPPPNAQPYHESVHTRTAVNTNHSGDRVCDVVCSTLAMHWHDGELRLSHCLTTVLRQSIETRFGLRRPPRDPRRRL